MVEIARQRKESIETQFFVDAAFDLARSLRIEKLLVQADLVSDIRLLEKVRRSERIIWLIRRSTDSAISAIEGDETVTIPDTSISRMSQMKIGLFLAVLNGFLELDESVLYLAGIAGSERLDTLVITNPKRDFPWFQTNGVERTRSQFATREICRIIDIALQFGAEGREGSPIGTIFVVGELDQLSPFLRQLILNPLEGHRQKDRNIHTAEFVETLREFAAMDGAFVVNSKGVVESAGTYLDAPLKRAKLRSGLGARHAAALGITIETDAIAVVLSQSSRNVTVYQGGKEVLQLDNPQAVPPAPVA